MSNKPRTVVTKHLVRNIILTIVLIAVGIAGYFVYDRIANRKPIADTIVTPKQEAPKPDEKPEETQDDGIDAITTLHLESAKVAITDYYTMLGTQDFSGLRSRGFDVAAGAIELGWTSQIGLEIHPEMLIPDVDALPTPVGTYAGNELYSIADFYKNPPAPASVKSLVTGESGPVGWIYNDALEDRWHVVDPTIPTGTQAPAANIQSRQSVDGLVNVEMSSPGVFRNQWWALTMMTVTITSSKHGVGVTPLTFDAGTTVIVPESLLVGISASEIPVVPEILPDGTQAPLQKKISGVCTIWRGNLKDFGIDRIGQSLMRIDGQNLSPISVIVNEEEVSPVFPVNNTTANQTARLLNQEQMVQYGLTGSATIDQTPEAGGAQGATPIATTPDMTVPRQPGQTVLPVQNDAAASYAGGTR